MSHACRARAETPLGAIALGTTPAAGTRLRPHEPLPVRPSLLLCAPILLVLLTHLSRPRPWPCWPCSLSSWRSPYPRTPRRGGWSRCWRCRSMAHWTRRGWTSSSGRLRFSQRCSFCGAAFTPPSSRAAGSEADCRTGRGTGAAQNPRPALDASPAAPPAGRLAGGSRSAAADPASADARSGAGSGRGC